MSLPPAVAIIPARGGSQGVKRKNLRTVGGVPLVVRSIRAALGSARVGRVIVSSDDPEVLAVARHAGAETHEREHSAGPDATVADVVAEVLLEIDPARGLDSLPPLVVLQPTSPFTDGPLIDAVLTELDEGGHDSVATVRPERHALWTKDGPLHDQSLNRQLAQPWAWRETGAVQAVRVFPAWGGPLRGAPLVGDQHHLLDPGELEAMVDGIAYEPSAAYALDVDTPEDFHVARDLSTRGYVTFIVTAGTDTGSGHLHRCLTLADELAHHAIRFQDRGDTEAWAVEMIQARGYAFDFRGKLGAPSLTVFDCLEHVTASDVLAIQSHGGRVAVLECLDPAVVAAADLAVNSLYTGPAGALTGPHWEPLRPEFAVTPARQQFDTGPPRVLVAFGGTDPSRLTERFSALVQAVLAQVPGRGELRVLWPPSREREQVPFSLWEGSVSEALAWADVAVTSAGRTVLEAAAMGCPTVAVGAHEREELHAAVPGVMWLGHHASLTNEAAGNAVRWLLENPGEARTRARRAAAAVDPSGAAVRLADLLDRLVRGWTGGAG